MVLEFNAGGLANSKSIQVLLPGPLLSGEAVAKISGAALLGLPVPSSFTILTVKVPQLPAADIYKLTLGRRIFEARVKD